ncbi:MAG: pirin family protein [Gammaproteobacteria bacterium]|jgi:redox-sensitive bicupin YhaK (pirin superfamily)
MQRFPATRLLASVLAGIPWPSVDIGPGFGFHGNELPHRLPWNGVANMSNQAPDSRSIRSEANRPAKPCIKATPTRDTEVGGGFTIRRALPHRARRMVGAWCFLDHFGPLDISAGEGLRVGPHPHIGLQTVTWLLEGEVLHRDSLGSLQAIRPGQLNLMTAGRGIAHSEESPEGAPADLHGVQFWLALPDSHRHIEPDFEHYPEVPLIVRDEMQIRLLVGEHAGVCAPARVHSPLVGLDVSLDAGRHVLPLNQAFEHAILVVEGEMSGEGGPMHPGTLYYLGSGRDHLSVESSEPARFLLLGGEPFAESIVLWWNFVARNAAEIRQAKEEWQAASSRFGDVVGYPGPRLQAPELRARLKTGR